MSRQRRAHNKSRAGCVQCKERHIRCDEAHPQCLNCKRLELNCSFASLALATMPLNEDSLADLELLDYWYRHPLIPGSPQRDQELRHAYVRLGFSYPYLLNSILALVSLRRFEENRDCTRWYARAVAHQQAAISRSRPYFQDLESSHHKAILTFATFTSLYAIAEPLRRPAILYRNRDEFDPIAEFVHAIQHSRASTTFVQQYIRAVTDSDAFMAVKHSSSQLEVACDLEAQFPQLLTLRNAIHGIPNDYDHRAVCVSSVERLFACMKILFDDDHSRNDDHLMVLFAWVKEVDSTFWEMCFARDPVALVILGHFAALMSLNQGVWLLQHWPYLLLRGIRDQVKDQHWSDLLQWPTNIVFREDGVPRFS